MNMPKYTTTDIIVRTGSIWKAIQPSNNTKIAIKVTNKYLSQHSIALNGQDVIENIKEDILKEASIMKYITNKDPPSSIVKCFNLFER